MHTLSLSIKVTAFALTLVFSAGIRSAAQPCTPQKIVVEGSMVTNEKRGRGQGSMLFDEQGIAGDPAVNGKTNPATIWFGGWDKRTYPVSCYVNLRNPVTISSIYIRDMNGNGAFSIESGSPGSWTPLLVDSLKNYKVWSAHKMNITTQFLRFTSHTIGASASEIVIYGCPGKDGGAPAAITDLRAGFVRHDAVQLVWKATGDDGKSGIASSYDIRYSTSPIKDLSTFAKATRVKETIQPENAGTVQTLLIKNLKPSTNYHFAIKASDDGGKSSGISNVITAATGFEKPKDVITMEKFIGTNAFIDDPIESMLAVGFIREYHNWRWDELSRAGLYKGYPDNQMKWSPSGANDGWDFDKYYADTKKAGLEVSPVIQASVPWLQTGKTFHRENKPINIGKTNTADPNSYEAKAHHMYQFAARYGSTKVPLEKLTIEASQPKNTGLGLIRYIEDWNEQNKTWEGVDAEFSAQEYAAMASADYDGHANTMTQGTGTFGVKNADPNMKLVMGGLAGYDIDLEFITDMKKWFENNRVDNKFAVDVINVHHYAWATEKTWLGPGPPKSPEADNFRERMETIVNFRDQNFPDVEVWISEFGWDTNPKSPLCVPTIPGLDIQEVQAQWIIRSYLAFAAARVDRAQMFMLRDVDPNSQMHFSSSGLVGPKDDWSPKKSWYYVYTMKNTLKNMVYLGEEKSADPNILIYKFKDVHSAQGAYVVWAKTSKNTVIKNYQLALKGSPKTAKKVELTPEKIDGTKTDLTITGNAVTLDVSERPVFVLVNSIR